MSPEAGLTLRCWKTGRKEGWGKKGGQSPHCYRPLRLLQALHESTERTVHLHFKQIEGLAEIVSPGVPSDG